MSPALSLAHWRARLTEGKEELHRQYQHNGNALALLRHLSRFIDQLLTDLWQEMALAPGLVLMAVGGYGRGELYPQSDIDLLILLPEGETAEHDGSLEELIRFLWDIGLEVGHSVRTLSQCLEEAGKDITVQTNLLEARFICGKAELFCRFKQAIRRQLNPVSFVEAKLLEQQQRHQRYHGTSYNLEPNLKESPGGLRDLQNVLWVSGALGLGYNWHELSQNGLLTREETQEIRRHELLLQNLRIRLHYLAKRKEDRLLFDHQKALAEEMGFADSGQRIASERLMQRYYRTAKAVAMLNELLLNTLREFSLPDRQADIQPIDDHFQIRNRYLEIRDENLYQQRPSAILETFLVLERNTKLEGLSPSTLRALWRAAPLIDATFRRQAENRELFMRILREHHGITHELRRMNRYGILGRYLPAFGRIIGQMQHDLFHVYTVDEHILFVVRNLRRFTVPEFAHEFPSCSRLIKGFKRQEILMVAALFHDIAKGRGGDHSQLGTKDARRFCKQHGIDDEDTELICWLVENHLVMSATAQKQDLSDPDIIAAFAARARDERHLTALYLLTVADIRGTSPQVWNAWKGKLLEDLYNATLRRLRELGETPSHTYLEERQAEALAILRHHAVADDAHLALWRQLDDSYFLRHDADEIAWHTRLLHRRVDGAQPVVRARVVQEGEGLQVLIYTHSHDYLFARICSFFERAHYNIVEAKIHTTRHGYALDSFVVLDEGKRVSHYRDVLNFVEYELSKYLEARTPPELTPKRRVSRHLKHFPILPQVNIGPDEKNIYHVLSLVAGDRPGLLSEIAQIFVKHHIHLHTAKITTLGERAEDTFLVTGKELSKPKEILRLETDLLHQLQPVQ